jgi:nitrite reductase/ring-hydroxylating ferredoxin subunit
VVRPVITERQLWKKLKNATTSISWTRLENWALFGTPDLLGYSNSGTFFTVELKSTGLKKSNLVRCSPHQISFHIKHKKNTFILVACSLELGHFRLYSGSRILELVDLGLKLEPLACGLDPCVRLLEGL